MNKLNSKNKFDPETAFFKLRIVRTTLWIGGLFVFGLSALIIIIEWRECDLSANGVNELFFNMLKAPLWSLGGFAALLALFATNHRSEQNKKTMEIASSQNIFSNHFKHVEEFEKFLDKRKEFITTKLGFTIPDGRRLHAIVYPNSKMGEHLVNVSVLTTIDSAIHEIVSAGALLSSKESYEKGGRLINRELHKLFDLFENSIEADEKSIPRNRFVNSIGDGPVDERLTWGTTPVELFEEAVRILSLAEIIVKFSPETDTNNLNRFIQKLEVLMFMGKVPTGSYYLASGFTGGSDLEKSLNNENLVSGYLDVKYAIEMRRRKI